MTQNSVNPAFDINVAQLTDVEKYLKQNGWYSVEGYLRVIHQGGMRTWVADISSLYTVETIEVEAYNQKGEQVKASRVHLEFHGGRSMHTRIYPTNSEVRKNMLACFIWLRDYYLDIQSKDFMYNYNIFDVKPKPVYDTEVYRDIDDTDDFVWELKK